jgi:uncharacterized protein YwgA
MDIKLNEAVAYVMKCLQTEGKYARTFVQKILYFVIEERDKLFKPYLYGPYSESVQRMIQYLEKESEDLDKWGIRREHVFYNKVDTVIEFIKKEGLKPTNIALLSKIHYIVSILKTDASEKLNEIISFLKEKSCDYGWREVYTKSDDELIDLLDQLKNTKILGNNIACFQ